MKIDFIGGWDTLVIQLKQNLTKTNQYKQIYNKYHKWYVPLNQSNLNRIVKGHDKDGYVILSNSRAFFSKQENDKRFNWLKNQLKYLKYPYVSVLGGYREAGETHSSLDKSVVVYPYVFEKFANDTTPVDFYEFEQDMLQLAKGYYQVGGQDVTQQHPQTWQDSILIKRPGKNPRYVYLNKPVNDYNDNYQQYHEDPEFTDVDVNNTAQQYFTALKGWADTSLNRKNSDWNKGNSQRFTFQAYFDQQPMGFGECYKRDSSGEFVVANFYNTK